MLWKSFSLAWAIALCFAPLAAAATVSLAPSKDNTLIQQANPATQTSNGQGDVFIGRTNQDGQNPATISIRRGLVAFNVAASIPAGATITSVTLTMTDLMGLNGDRTAELHRALQDWGEGSSFQNGGMGAPSQNNDATWLYTFYNFASPASSPTWSTPGGDFSATVSASTIIYDQSAPGPIFPTGSSFTWSSAVDPQMLVDVQDWLDNPGNNFGWLMLGDESAGQTAKRLGSGESATPPSLMITYVPEPSALTLLAGGALFVAVLRLRVRSDRQTRMERSTCAADSRWLSF